MKYTILGQNGSLSYARGKYVNNNGWILDVYGLDEPVGIKCDKFISCNLMEVELDRSPLLDSYITVYAIGVSIQSNFKERLINFLLDSSEK